MVQDGELNSGDGYLCLTHSVKEELEDENNVIVLLRCFEKKSP